MYIDDRDLRKIKTADANEETVLIKTEDSQKPGKMEALYSVRGGKIVSGILWIGPVEVNFFTGDRTEFYCGGCRIAHHVHNKKRKGYQALLMQAVSNEFLIERYVWHATKVAREIAFYHKNGRLFYNAGSGNKHIKVFNADGSIAANLFLQKGLNLRKRWASIRNPQPQIDLNALRELRERFHGKWRYELYDEQGSVYAWLEGNGRIAEAGEKFSQKIYFIRGVEVSEKIFNGIYDAREALSYPNVTVRSELISRYGLDRIVQELQGATVDKNEIYELLTFPLPETPNGDPKMQVLKMRCPSTQVWYALRVPPQCRNIGEAINWTYGLSLRDVSEGKGVDILGAT